MKVGEIAEILSARILSGRDSLDEEVYFAFASDLMSDVLTLENDGLLLITGLSNLQSIRTAEMSDVRAIIIGRGKSVSEEMIKLAEMSNIILLTCEYSVYRISGILFGKGIKPVY